MPVFNENNRSNGANRVMLADGSGHKDRVNPEVDTQLLNDLRVAARAFNDGKLKGRTGPLLDEAIVLYLVSLYATNPKKLQNIEDFVDTEDYEELDDPDEYRRRILGYEQVARSQLKQTGQQLQQDGPDGTTRFEQFLSIGVDGDLTPENPINHKREEERSDMLNERLIDASAFEHKPTVTE